MGPTVLDYAVRRTQPGPERLLPRSLLPVGVEQPLRRDRHSHVLIQYEHQLRQARLGRSVERKLDVRTAPGLSRTSEPYRRLPAA